MDYLKLFILFLQKNKLQTLCKLYFLKSEYLQVYKYELYLALDKGS